MIRGADSHEPHSPSGYKEKGLMALLFAHASCKIDYGTGLAKLKRICPRISPDGLVTVWILRYNRLVVRAVI